MKTYASIFCTTLVALAAIISTNLPAHGVDGNDSVKHGAPFPTPGCIAEWAWLDRELPAEGVAGSPVVVSYSIRGGSASIVEMRERIPAGWQVISPMWEERNEDIYVWDGRVHALELLPPADLPAGEYHFSGSTTSWHWCNGEVYRSIDGDDVIRISAAEIACPGDCDGDGAVLVDELVTAVSIALGTVELSSCAEVDVDGDGQVTVDELAGIVTAAVGGCVGDLQNAEAD